MISFSDGQPVKTSDADAFFVDLLEKVESLEEYGGPHPLTAPLAAATAKRYLAEDRHRIRLEDLVRGETERLYAELFVPELYPPDAYADMTETGFSRRVEGYRRRTDVLLATMIASCYHDDARRTVWSDALQRMSSPPYHGGHRPLFQMRLYPALLLLYGGGIAAMAGERYATLANLLYRARMRRLGDEEPVALGFSTAAIHDAGAWMNNHLQADAPPERRRRFYYPMSEHLYTTLREPLREILPDEADYESRFDQFEYVRGVVHIAQRRRHNPGYPGAEGHGPAGRFGPRLRYQETRRALEQAEAELEALAVSSAAHPGGSPDELTAAKGAYDAYLNGEPWERF